MLKLLSLFTLAAFAAQLCAAAAPRAVSAAEFLGGSVDGLRVEIVADVSDALNDETNPRYVFLVLEKEGETIYAPVKCGNDNMSSVERLVGARIRATGVCLVLYCSPLNKAVIFGVERLPRIGV